MSFTAWKLSSAFLPAPVFLEKVSLSKNSDLEVAIRLIRWSRVNREISMNF